MLRTIRPLPVLLVLIATVSLSACEDTVNPFVEEDRFFTLFGYLDTASDTQYLRVVPLQTSIVTDGGAPIDAAVSTIDLTSGIETAWQDSVVSFDDGSRGHVFVGEFRPIPGRRYRLVTSRSDGMQASAETTVPLATATSVGEPIITSESIFQRVFWEDVPADPFRIEVWYRFVGLTPRDPFIEAVLTYQEMDFGSPSNGGWEIFARLTEDRPRVSEALTVSPDAGLTLLGMGARLTMSDDQWRPPTGVFDRELLVQPGTFSNVEGGFGFFGAVNQYSLEWTLSPQITERAGYRYPGD